MTGNRGVDVMVVADDRSPIGAVGEALAAATGCRLGAFSSPDRALADLEPASPAVVIADARIRGIESMSFLERAGEKVPAATRILLGGGADGEPAVQAIEELEIQSRPAHDRDLDRLVLMVRHAIERADLLTEVQERSAELAEVTSELGRIRRRITEIFL